ncbi:MAG: cupin domain-containing protein [Candidatus Limnocylindria bacterium]
MPIEIRRFGVGHRRADGPPGTVAVRDQVIHSDASLTITELAFARGGRIEPYASPNPIWFICIEGGGWVGVGDERARVAAGEAVRWPADVPHAAWTEHSEMRAFTVEATAGDGTLEGRAVELLADPPADRDRPRPRPIEPDAGEPA